MLELSDGDVKDEAELTKERGGREETVFDWFVISAGGLEAG